MSVLPTLPIVRGDGQAAKVALSHALCKLYFGGVLALEDVVANPTNIEQLR